MPTESSYPERIVQFGGGNFLRGFIDWMIDVLNDETDFKSGVVIVKVTQGGSYATIDEQNGRYNTHLHGLVDDKLVTETRLIKCVFRTIHSYQDYEGYLALAHQPEVRFIISNTTEAGITYMPDDKLEDRPASSFPAKLTAFLYERYCHFGGDTSKGCIILPCELIEDNGRKLQEIVLRHANQWALGNNFGIWLHTHNTFCNTLVDRIVTGFPIERKQILFTQLGYEDQLLVEGEQYHSWIIEGETWIKDELPFYKTDLNVFIVDDLTPYRELKVYMLNASHTTMVPVGYLLGLETVYEAVEHPLLGALIRKLVFDEVIPILNLPKETLEQFGEHMLTRFRNPFLHHRLLSIALNSLSKYRTRLLPIILKTIDTGNALPDVPVFALAALLRFYKGDWQGLKIPLKDDIDQIVWIGLQWEVAVSMEDLTRTILAHSALWGQDLNMINGLTAQVATYLQRIESVGIENTLRLLLER